MSRNFSPAVESSRPGLASIVASVAAALTAACACPSETVVPASPTPAASASLTPSVPCGDGGAAHGPNEGCACRSVRVSSGPSEPKVQARRGRAEDLIKASYQESGAPDCMNSAVANTVRALSRGRVAWLHDTTPDQPVSAFRPATQCGNEAFVTEVCAKISSEYVVRNLGRSKWSLGLFPGGTVAESGLSGFVSLDPGWLRTRNETVATMWHEATHRIARKTDTRAQEYLDGDHDWSTEPWLASYVVGDLAYCAHLHGDDVALAEQCFASRVAGNTANRRDRECSAKLTRYSPANWLSWARNLAGCSARGKQ
jgi:hypothetical protein